ncbi:MAG: S1 family peptidase [Oligoflexales bacterium]|nr:S1 family peptidase [Oligoflexales bacterium]
MNLLKQSVLPFLIFTVTASACLPINPASVKITDGTDTGSDEYPSVVLLIMDKNLSCSGTFLNDYQVVTAAHCLPESVKKIEVFYGGDNNGKKPVLIGESTKYTVNPKYREVQSATYDLGVIDFPKNTSKKYEKISAKAPTLDDPFTIVGYGDRKIDENVGENMSILSDGGLVKRKGTNRITVIKDGVLMYKGSLGSPDGSQAKAGKSGTAKGDSGGPLFNEQGELIGVTSQAIFDLDESQKKILSVTNVSVSLNSSHSREFLSKTIVLTTEAGETSDAERRELDAKVKEIQNSQTPKNQTAKSKNIGLDSITPVATPAASDKRILTETATAKNTEQGFTPAPSKNTLATTETASTTTAFQGSGYQGSGAGPNQTSAKPRIFWFSWGGPQSAYFFGSSNGMTYSTNYRPTAYGYYGNYW